MPQTPHIEKHFTGNEIIRDIVIGMSDGLTVPFALAAGLSGATDQTSIVVTAGLAEMAAGAIAMGLGGYLAARGDMEHYDSERRREEREIVEKADAEVAEVREILQGLGVPPAAGETVVEALKQSPKAWVDFMMKLELGLEKPDPKRAPISAFTIGGSYVAGGMIPLLPYFFSASTSGALVYSVILTLIALLLFGGFKGRFTGAPVVRSALQTLVVGGLAAAAAFGIARVIG